MASASAVRLGTPALVGDLAAPRASADPRELTRHGGLLRYYVLEGAGPGSTELPGLFDRHGSPPA
jgi:hypothetical protein